MDVHASVHYLYSGLSSDAASLTDKILDATAVAEHSQAHTVLVRDGRRANAPRSEAARALLEGEGYYLCEHVSAVTDWYDQEEVARTYHAEAQEIVKAILGPDARVFPTGGHILRDEKPLVRDAALQAPARSVHNDFAPSHVKNFQGDKRKEEEAAAAAARLAAERQAEAEAEAQAAAARKQAEMQAAKQKEEGAAAAAAKLAEAQAAAAAERQAEAEAEAQAAAARKQAEMQAAKQKEEEAAAAA
eukprot:COSAG03_NODE_5674_length_1197_cov_2.010018_2_plen_245_part_01